MFYIAQLSHNRGIMIDKCRLAAERNLCFNAIKINTRHALYAHWQKIKLPINDAICTILRNFAPQNQIIKIYGRLSRGK